VSRDIHQPKLAEIRLELLSKLTALVGCVDYDDVAEALAGVPVPGLADWCIVHLVEDRHIVRTFVNQHDPDKAALRDEAMRVAPDWKRNPLWNEMRLTTGFQLLTDVSDEFLRKFAVNEEQYCVWARAGVRSIMVQPVVSRGEIAALLTLIYTTESGRRYGRDAPALGEELALHAAHIIENARLLKAIRESDARFRVCVASARTVVYEQDEALRYVWYHNPIVPISLVGKTHDEAFPADEANVLTERKRHVLESGQRVTEELQLTLGGERRTYREAIEPLRDEVGKVVGVAGSATDITEEKRKQHQLDEALTFRKQMMGVLGHDLRDPLNAVNLATGTLVGRGHLSDEDKVTVQVIRRAADRMTEMVGTLLDLTRVEALGKMPIAPVATDLGVIAREAIEEARSARPDRTIDVEIRGNINARADPARMKQAMSNLITNALQHGDPQGPVRVSADGEDVGVVIRVANQGPAIPPDTMQVLFEPFSRRTSPGKASEGLGLGLYIVRQIAIAHGGTIHVESSDEEGTTFAMLLPRSI
jgi:signal transduction histidine kinase